MPSAAAAAALATVHAVVATAVAPAAVVPTTFAAAAVQDVLVFVATPESIPFAQQCPAVFPVIQQSVMGAALASARVAALFSAVSFPAAV